MSISGVSLEDVKKEAIADILIVGAKTTNRRQFIQAGQERAIAEAA